jgi:preprotein translocase subunit SecE
MSRAQPSVKEPNFVVRFYRETIGELRKVVWPTWPEARNLTVVVLVVITLFAIFLGLFDFLFAELFRLIINLPG